MNIKLKILSVIRGFVRFILSPVEHFILGIVLFGKNDVPPPVFVIGPPRSGTTLLYQILIQRFSFVYFTNFAAKFFYAPILGLFLSKIIERKALQTEKYYSSYGKTQSLVGPHEAGEFWYRWFPRGKHVYVPPDTTTDKDLQQLRQQVAGISSVFRLPALFKNTYNAMRIAPLVEAFPEATFLVCRRSPLDIAQSILDARLRSNNDKNAWWSVPPKEVDHIRSHPYWEQVVEQVYYIYRQIDSDRQQVGDEHFLDISYQELCYSPHMVMETIRDFFSEKNVELQIKGDIPEKFPFSTGQKVSDEDHARLQQKVSELWND